MCRRNVNIIEQSRTGHRAEKYCIAEKHCIVYVCLYLICTFLYILLASCYIYTSSYMFAYLLALNFAFSKIKMLKFLFILFVIKQLLGNLTSDVNTYSAKAKYYLTRER